MPSARGELHSILNDDLLKSVHAWTGLLLPELRFSCTPSMLDAMSDTFQSPYSVVTQVQDVKEQVRLTLTFLFDVKFLCSVFWFRNPRHSHIILNSAKIFPFFEFDMKMF